MLYPIQNDIRNKFDISGIWDFQADPEETGEKNGWFNALPNPRPLAVPGSWNEQYEDLYNYFGLGWYLKRTYIPAAWKSQRVYIRVGSANYGGTVYINGTKIGAHEGGHLPFAFDITERVKWNTENVIAISVENHLTPTRVPSGNLGSSLETGNNMTGYPSSTVDFFPFAGIQRPVVLYSVPNVHLTDVTVVTEIDGENAWVKVTAQINGRQDKGRLVLAGDKMVEVPVAFNEGFAEAVISVPSARLWSEKDPYLYDLTIVTSTDKYTLKVGIRTIAVRGKQVLLNGQPIQLKGYGRHEDFIASGKGLNLPLLVKDYALMRWTGANSYRTSHYPYSEEEMHFKEYINLPPVNVRIIDAQGGLHTPFVYGLKMERDKVTLRPIHKEDTSAAIYPIVLFVPGDEYKLWGLIPGNIHLFGLKADSDKFVPLFLLGSNTLGQDMLSRIFFGGRISLTVGLIGVFLAFFMGLFLGGIAGFFGGLLDEVIMRIIDVLMALPTIPLWMSLAAALPQDWPQLKTYFYVTIILSIFGWTMLARVVRGKLLSLREEDYVMAARLDGESDAQIISRYMLPGFTSYIIVSLTLAIPNMILGETSLSFLGVGLRPPTVSWGVMLQEAQNLQTIAQYPWLLWPVVFVVIAVLMFNFLGDGLRDAADPYVTG